MPVRSTSDGSSPTHAPQDSLAGVGGDVQEAFAQGARKNLRNDLLVAADSITNTMSSLVKELHSDEGGEGEEEGKMQNGKDRVSSRAAFLNQWATGGLRHKVFWHKFRILKKKKKKKTTSSS
ncbi:UNVERIFIED_CONTAM: hypothetical protein FKN15_028125 [Acipenser sinensis]